MIETKLYRLKSGNKKEFFTNVLKNHNYHREKIVCFNMGEPKTNIDMHNKEYHVLDTTVFVNNYNSLKDPLLATTTVATITAGGNTKKDCREKIRIAKTLLEKLGGEKLLKKDIYLGK